MQLGWDTCRPSSPSNGAAQENRLNTTGDRQVCTIMAAPSVSARCPFVVSRNISNIIMRPLSCSSIPILELRCKCRDGWTIRKTIRLLEWFPVCRMTSLCTLRRWWAAFPQGLNSCIFDPSAKADREVEGWRESWSGGLWGTRLAQTKYGTTYQPKPALGSDCRPG